MPNRVINYLNQNSAKIELGVKVVSAVTIAAAFGYFAGRFNTPIRPEVFITEEAVDKMYRIQNHISE